jgi:hypothetical protein
VRRRATVFVRRVPVWALAPAVMFGGAALLVHILFQVSLPLGLAAFGFILILVGASFIATSRSAQRRRLAGLVFAGLVSGLLATLMYDGTKVVLSVLDPSPYNPFEVTRLFGVLLLGESAAAEAAQIAGWSFHLLNGCTFAVAYSLLLARDGNTTYRYAGLSGMAWGLFLEAFQVVLYPDWLRIAFYGEFVTISATAHLVYGACLGLTCRAVLRRRRGKEIWE